MTCVERCYGFPMTDPVPSEQPEPTPFERMQALATRVLAMPKSEVDKREEEWRKEREKSSDKKAHPA